MCISESARARALRFFCADKREERDTQPVLTDFYIRISDAAAAARTRPFFLFVARFSKVSRLLLRVAS